MKNFSLIVLMALVSTALNAQPQANDCLGDNQNFRVVKNQQVSDANNTPFSSTDLNEFTSLFYYPVDCQFIYEARYKAVPAKMVDVETTTTGRTVQLYDVGTVDLTLNGNKKSLQVYKNYDMPEFPEGTLFIPIKDGTTGGTTFAEGRYVVIAPPEQGGKFQVDFNMAVNPYQNYNSTYSSLLTPAGNVMAAPLTVGERKYEDRTR